MKLIREYVNEKFKEDSDPIKDIGIGRKGYFKHILDTEFNGIPFDELYDKFYKDQYFDGEEYSQFYHNSTLLIILKMLEQLVKNENQDEQLLFYESCKQVFRGTNMYTVYGVLLNLIRKNAANILRKKFGINVKHYYIKNKKINEHINEKFEESFDPISDLGIGIIHQIKQWMKSIGENFINKDNALIVCSKYGKTDFVKYLLDAGADVHAQDDYALRWASYRGHIKVVKLLLDAGANVHTRNNGALQGASYNGHTDIVKLLLDAGADVHAKNDKALQWASYYGYIEIVKLLLDAGADVHAQDDYALRWASIYGHTNVVKLLLDAGADVHAKNDEALRGSSTYGHADVVKLLKDHIAKEKEKVKESLNEKFEEDSDPIEDLKIGNVWKRLDIGDIIKNTEDVHDIFSHFITYGVIVDIRLNRNILTLELIPVGRFEDAVYIATNKLFKKINYITWVCTQPIEIWNKYFDVYKSPNYEIQESLNEKFEEDSDPIHDLGIGDIDIMFQDIIQPILDKYNTKNKNVNKPLSTIRYFKEFKKIVEPIILNRYVRGEMWEVGGKWKKPDFTIKVTNILSPGTIFKDPFIKGLLYFTVRAFNSKKYCLYLKKKYHISSTPKGNLCGKLL